MMRVNELEERMSDRRHVDDKEAEEKREKQLKGHEERLREINDSLRRKNLHIEQIIAENFPNLERETGIQIQEIEISSINKIK